MVLIVRRELLSRLSQSPVVQAFAGYFLLGKTPPAEIPGTNERDRITIEAIRSIALNDPQVFELLMLSFTWQNSIRSIRLAQSS